MNGIFISTGTKPRGLIIAGYGGAEIWTPGVPERYVVSYRGGIGVEDHQNEMLQLFRGGQARRDCDPSARSRHS